MRLWKKRQPGFLLTDLVSGDVRVDHIGIAFRDEVNVPLDMVDSMVCAEGECVLALRPDERGREIGLRFEFRDGDEASIVHGLISERVLARRSSNGHWVAGVRWAEDGMLSAAEDELEAALRIDPENVEAVNSLGVLRAQMGEMSTARELFERALSLDGAHTEAAQNLQRAQAVAER